MTSLHDDEQFQKIKEWWNKHGTALLLIIAIAAGINFGWQYMHKYKIKKAEQASLIYEQLLAANLNKKTDDFNMLAQQLRDHYASTPYASLAQLLVAHNDFNNGDMPAAQKDLQWVIDNANSSGLKEIAKLREARLLLENKKPEDALAILEKVDDQTFLPMIHLVRGDILLALNKKQEALNEYLAAKNGQDPNTSFAEIIELKISHANL
jgi:predicted negative regulator of RcsB-dependent stress response